jgi:hypothetical protein
MDLLVVIAQLVKDLLGNLNPFRLFRRDYRASFHDLWERESRVARAGYVLGTVGLLILLAVVAFAVWQGYRHWFSG